MVQESFSRKIGSLFVHPATVGGFHIFIVIGSRKESVNNAAKIIFRSNINMYAFSADPSNDAWKQVYP